MELGQSTGTSEGGSHGKDDNLEMPKLTRQKAPCNYGPYAQKPPLAPKRRLPRVPVVVYYVSDDDDDEWDARMVDVD